jgi:hypothetical protein
MTSRSWFGVVVVGVAACLVVASLVGCAQRRAPRLRGEDVGIAKDVAPILQGTVGAQASLSGLDPVYVTGYGVVVGLAGTGSTDVPLGVRAHLEDEMRRLGVGSGNGPLADITPWEVLADRNTCVVLVQGLMPPAAPDGEVFDLRVETLPGTAATSLEGGILYTTNLYQGVAIPNGPAVRPVATARGEVFINPFEDPAKDPIEEGGSPRTVGRVLGGGTVSSPFLPILILDTPSHSRARSIAAAVNSRFPRGPDREVAAYGINEETIELHVPGEYRGRADDFFQLVLHLRVDRTFPDEWARRYAEALKEQPELSADLSWCLRAVGEVALPSVRPLYSYPEMAPRMAALETGAWLGDPLTRSHLEAIALDGPIGFRAPAVRLLAKLPTDPRVTRFLLDMVDSSDVEMRVAAYETLDEMGDPVIRRRVFGNKFRLDVVPSSEPMVYVRQQEEPRIVLFGDLELMDPAFVYAWDGRLIVVRESGSSEARLMYRDYRRAEVVEEETGSSLWELLTFLAHKPTPESLKPGLNFTYSEAVGAVYEMIEAGGVDATFVPEEDKLALELIRLAQRGALETRPELSEDDEWTPEEGEIEVDLAGQRGSREGERDEAWEQRRGRYVVPLRDPAGEGDGSPDEPGPEAAEDPEAEATPDGVGGG